MKGIDKKYEGKEENFQITVAHYLDSLGVLWFHSPNEIRAKPHYMKKRKKMGVKSGVPDICILEPRGDWCGLFIELKVGYNKPSENQKEFLKRLEINNYKTIVSWSLDGVIEEINCYLNK
jgi:hypothetical protein|tara:strand:+ start:4438 stop:4797 length:360 start_codon:yes stop_codon:yes gene_type:complete